MGDGGGAVDLTLYPTSASPYPNIILSVVKNSIGSGIGAPARAGINWGTRVQRLRKAHRGGAFGSILRPGVAYPNSELVGRVNGPLAIRSAVRWWHI